MNRSIDIDGETYIDIQKDMGKQNDKENETASYEVTDAYPQIYTDECRQMDREI